MSETHDCIEYGCHSNHESQNDEMILQLQEDVKRWKTGLDNNHKIVENLSEEIKKKDIRIDALLYTMVVLQHVIRNRENDLQQYEKQFGKLSLAG